jgi:hypothetical protein
LLGVLGGGNKTQYTVDPQTGTMQSIQVPQSRGQLAKNILAGAITGMLAPEQKPQPGREISQGLMRGAQAQQQKTAQQSQQAQTTATDDYNRQQQVKVRQMQTAEANLRLYSMAQQLGTHDKDVIQQQIDDSDSKSLIAKAQDLGKLVATKIAGKEAMNVQKYPVTEYIHTPDGVVQRTDPATGNPVWIHADGSVGTDKTPGSREAWDATYSVIKNDMSDDLREHTEEKVGANTTVKTPGNLKPIYKDAQFYGIGGPQFANAVNLHGQLPIPVGSNLKTQVMGMNFLAAEAENMAKVTGKPLTDAEGNPISGRDYTRQFVKDNPSLLTSVGKWQHAPGVEPDNKYQSLMNSQDPGTQAARSDMAKFFGGEQQFEAYKDAKADQRDAGKIGAETKARVEAEANTPEGKAKLANEFLSATEKKLHIQQLREDLAGANLSNIETKPMDDDVHYQPDPNYRVNQDVLDKLPPPIAATVKAIGEAREVMTPQAARTKDGQRVMNAVNMVYPDYSGIKVESYLKGRQAGTSGTPASKLNSFATAMDHLQRYYDNVTTIAAMPGVSSIAAALGNTEAKNLEVDKTALSTELASAYKGGAAPAEDEIRRWDSHLGGVTAVERRNGAKEVARLLSGKFHEYSNQYRNMIPGGLRDDNFQLMSQTAQDAYKHVTGKDIGNVQPFTQGQNTPQNTKATQQTQQFSLGAWQKANPTGDINAAKAAAAQAGYTVIQ